MFEEAVGTLAQLVEQRTFNPFVVGSTPARPTKDTQASPWGWLFSWAVNDF
jgi:hypothetical protein